MSMHQSLIDNGVLNPGKIVCACTVMPKRLCMELSCCGLSRAYSSAMLRVRLIVP